MSRKCHTHQPIYKLCNKKSLALARLFYYCGCFSSAASLFSGLTGATPYFCKIALSTSSGESPVILNFEAKLLRL